MISKTFGSNFWHNTFQHHPIIFQLIAPSSWCDKHKGLSYFATSCQGWYPWCFLDAVQTMPPQTFLLNLLIYWISCISSLNFGELHFSLGPMLSLRCPTILHLSGTSTQRLLTPVKGRIEEKTSFTQVVSFWTASQYQQVVWPPPFNCKLEIHGFP